MFKNKRQELFSLLEDPSLENAVEFAVPEEAIFSELKKKLILLADQKNNFIIEQPLKSKDLVVFSNLEDLEEAIKRDLDHNFTEFTTEFTNEPLGFVYYLGNHILFSNSVEILQKIYNKERDDIGNLYYSLVIKFNKGKYYYWNW